MKRTITIALPAITRRNELGLVLQHVLQSVALINAEWVLGEWSAGRSPACCAKCNGTLYKPDADSINLNFATSPVIFERGYASCGEIAACHTGHKIAEAHMGQWSDGRRTPPLSWADACKRYFVLFDGNVSSRGVGVFHALCSDDGKILDPTATMKRAS